MTPPNRPSIFKNIYIFYHDINPCLPCEQGRRRCQSRRMFFASEIVSRSTRQLFSLWLSAPSALSNLPPSPPFCASHMHCSRLVPCWEVQPLSLLSLQGKVLSFKRSLLCNVVAHVMVLLQLLQVMHALRSSVLFIVKFRTEPGCQHQFHWSKWPSV